MSFSPARRLFHGVVGSVAASALLLSGLTPAAGTPTDDQQPSPVVEPVVDPSAGRPDAVSAQITARASGERVEDLSARTATEKVFANPDGSWTLEAFTAPVHQQGQDGDMVPVRESQSLEESGSTLIGAVSELTVADGQASMGDGPTEESVPLATVVTEHQGEQATLSLGWEGELPAPEVTRNQAVFTEGISIPVTGPATDQDQTPAPGQPAADPSPTTTTTPQASAPAPASSPASAPTSTAPSPSAGGLSI